MKQAKGNLFEMSCDALCITTNGFTKSNGECVMGKGCAKQLADFYPEVPLILGELIRKNGNVTQVISNYGVPVIAFPVKPIAKPYTHPSDVVRHMQPKIRSGSIPGWACVADIDIIMRSAYQLVALADELNLSNVLLPRPGCGAGELSWNVVGPMLNQILDDRFTAVTF